MAHGTRHHPELPRFLTLDCAIRASGVSNTYLTTWADVAGP